MYRVEGKLEQRISSFVLSISIILDRLYVEGQLLPYLSESRTGLARTFRQFASHLTRKPGAYYREVVASSDMIQVLGVVALHLHSLIPNATPDLTVIVENLVPDYQ